MLGRLLPAMAGVGAVAATAGAGYLIMSPSAALSHGAGGESDVELLDRVPTRQQQLSKLRGSSAEKPFDVLIVGGGATGTGTAVDAVTRGLKTALVEREDFASGTSSKSTKLVHGGVRYLEKAVYNLDVRQLNLVTEALHERRLMLENAPHLSHPLPILTPCYSWWELPYYWAGLKAYDLVAGRGNLVMSKYVSNTEALDMMPTLASASPDGRSLKGGVLYYDGQFDDARFNVALACTAAAAGAAVANYVEVRALIKNTEGKVTGARVCDVMGGTEADCFDVHAKLVVNSTGPFVDALRGLSNPEAKNMVMPSSGAHVTLPGWYGSARTGLIVPKTKDGRVVFMLPWLGGVIAGTTDEPCAITTRPTTSAAEVDFILEALQDHLGMKVRRSDVLSVWSGIRPLALDPSAKDTSNAVREHVVVSEGDGMITVSGGKWTTYRRMAADVVDAAVATGRMPLNVQGCRTEGLKLVGAARFSPALFAELSQEHSTQAALVSSALAAAASAPSTSPAAAEAATMAAPVESHALDARTAQHLAAAYGDRARRVLQLAESTSTPALGSASSPSAGASPTLARRLVPGHPYLEAEVLYCMRNEYCCTAEDFLARRTRLAFLDAAAAVRAVPRVVELMGEELGWDRARREAEGVSARKFLATFLPPLEA